MIAVLSLLILSSLPLQDATAQAPAYKVVVSAANPITTLTQRDAALIFLKKKTRWESGDAIVPVDQTANSLVRVAFTRDVLAAEGLSRLSAVQIYWQQQLYSGRSTPPLAKGTDAEVVAFVAGNPNAIGYVSHEAALPGVKTVKVEP